MGKSGTPWLHDRKQLGFHSGGCYFKGVKVDDLETLYKGLIHGTENVHPEVSSTGRLGYEYYNKLGYVPYDVKINENAARTLEYAYNDWCIYKLAKDLKRPKKEGTCLPNVP